MAMLSEAANKNGRIDRLAMTVSGMCLLHCLASALLLGTMSAVGGFLGSPLVHELGLALAIVLGVVALGRGISAHRRFLPPAIGALGIGAMIAALALPHGGSEIIATMIGVVLLAVGHYLNRLAIV